MPQNERRNAYRYTPTRDKLRLGWWDGQQFRTISARLKCLSFSGSLVQLEEGAAGPAGVNAWICVVDQSPAQWVQAEIVEVCAAAPDAPPDTPCVLRLKFVDSFPYEAFKTAVWDDAVVEKKPNPGGGETPVSKSEEHPAPVPPNPDKTTQSVRIGFFTKPDARNPMSSDRAIAKPAAPEPQPRTLPEGDRSQSEFRRKTALFPWRMVL